VVAALPLDAESLSTLVATLIAALLVIRTKPLPPFEFNDPVPLDVMLLPELALVSTDMPPLAVTGLAITTEPAVAVSDSDAAPKLAVPDVVIAGDPALVVFIEIELGGPATVMAAPPAVIEVPEFNVTGSLPGLSVRAPVVDSVPPEIALAPVVEIDMPPLPLMVPVVDMLLLLLRVTAPAPSVMLLTVRGCPVCATVTLELLVPPPFVAASLSTLATTLMAPLFVDSDNPVPPEEVSDPVPLVVMLCADAALVSIEMPPLAVTGLPITTDPAVAVSDSDVEPASVMVPPVVMAGDPLLPLVTEMELGGPAMVIAAPPAVMEVAEFSVTASVPGLRDSAPVVDNVPPEIALAPVVEIDTPPLPAIVPDMLITLLLLTVTAPAPPVTELTVRACPPSDIVMLELLAPPPLVAVSVSVSVATLMVPLFDVKETPVPPVELSAPAPLVVMVLAKPELVSIETPPFAVTAPVMDTLLVFVRVNVPEPSVTPVTFKACPVWDTVMLELLAPFVADNLLALVATLIAPLLVVSDSPMPPVVLSVPAPLVVMVLPDVALVSIEMLPLAVTGPVIETLLLLVSMNEPAPSVIPVTLMA
jgi:hypothetical protein